MFDPIFISFTSPRITDPYQTDDPLPIVTDPITDDEGDTKVETREGEFEEWETMRVVGVKVSMWGEISKERP